jgi:hypothetical protein
MRDVLGAALVTIPEHDTKILLGFDFVLRKNQSSSFFKYWVQVAEYDTCGVQRLSKLSTS